MSRHVRMDLLARNMRNRFGPRRFRIVACPDDQRAEIISGISSLKSDRTSVVMVSRDWKGHLPGGSHDDDDLMLLIDPNTDRVALGRWVNQLRDAGHAVEIVWSAQGE